MTPITPERLDRIATISQLAVAVFEDEQTAIAWLSRPNEALGGQLPAALCETETGVRQVQRVLHALEYGGVV